MMQQLIRANEEKEGLKEEMNRITAETYRLRKHIDMAEQGNSSIYDEVMWHKLSL